jgi:hypothetical protein
LEAAIKSLDLLIQHLLQFVRVGELLAGAVASHRFIKLFQIFCSVIGRLAGAAVFLLQ